MIAVDLGPVVDALIFVLSLGEWAVTAADVETIAEVCEGRIAVEIERRESARYRRTCDSVARVQPRNAEGIHGGHVGVGVMGLRVIAEPTETEVSQPSGAKCLVEPGGKTVIVNVGRSVQAAWTKTGAAESTKGSVSRKAEVVQAKATKNLEVAGSVPINAGVHAVLFKGTGARTVEIVGGRSVRGRRKFRQDIGGLWGNPVHRNLEVILREARSRGNRTLNAAKYRPVSTGIWIAGPGVVDVVARITSFAVTDVRLVGAQVAKAGRICVDVAPD